MNKLVTEFAVASRCCSRCNSPSRWGLGVLFALTRWTTPQRDDEFIYPLFILLAFCSVVQVFGPPLSPSSSNGSNSHVARKSLFGRGGERGGGGFSKGHVRPFRFVSVFKWEARKGWDVLLKVGGGPGFARGRWGELLFKVCRAWMCEW